MIARPPQASIGEPYGAGRAPPVRRWRPTDIVTLVVVVCYGAATLIVAVGLFVRLASHP